MEPEQRRLRGRVAEAVSELRTLPDVGAALSAALRCGVPHDGWVLFEFDPRSSTRVNEAGEGGITTVSDLTFVRNECEGGDRIRFVDLARQQSPAGILSGSLPSQRLNEFMKPAGFGSELRVCIRSRGTLWGGVVLLRRDDVRDFSADDARAALSACQPLLANLRAIRSNAGRAAAPRAAGVVVVDHRGEIESASETAQAWFADLLGRGHSRSQVPRVIYEVSHHRDAAPVIRQLDTGGWAALSASRLEPDRTAICIRTPTTTELVPTVALRRSYAPRETQILQLLIDGAASKHIARELNVSAHTVDFHLGNLYRKSEVSGREELLAQFAT